MRTKEETTTTAVMKPRVWAMRLSLALMGA